MSQIQREQVRVVAEKAVLVAVAVPNRYFAEDDPLGELRALAETAGATIVGEMIQKRQKPSGRTYLGKGKTEELARLVDETGATLAIFDNDLTPAQIKAVEEETACKVLDRSELILDIFANRAATHAAKLQVEIAQLQYTYPRLRAMWSHLEQIVGGAPVGIGTRGPGEQQLEIDRRLVQRRLRQLRTELQRIQQRKTREVQKRNLDYFTVGLVGYTNAGKSTLFNRVTEGGGAFAHEKLFATLATRIERWDFGGGNAAMLSDTVGFIRELPHHLVASFKSTLEETVHADLLLIVVDVSDPHAAMQLETVESTLNDIEATEQPRVLILNKIDRVADRHELLLWLNRLPDAITISAATGEGVESLAQLVRSAMLGELREVMIRTPLADSRTVDFLEKRTEVLERNYLDSEAELRVRIGRRQIDQLLARGARFQVNGVEPPTAIDELWPPPAREALSHDAPTPPHERYR